ncbi:chromatin remodeling complex protein [Suillus paluster]|uniref:chromatin remodeling complex protein n=1 Tax=Suillus paluster TaxID=48578 RepID=UPI001B870C1A|nr:chromatin remodeling complex protein [Suillus paluster]KAG1755110.1 chromatin remodeling complex protein [Suillus paluster]
MPTCRRKRVVLTEPSEALLQAAKSNPNKEVYYLQQTGEIFETYEAYAARMSFYRLKQFQCEVTGKSGLDYFQALESEQQEAQTMHARFPEPLKAAVLKAVQWQVVGRLDHLVEAVFDRFKDRYFADEKVFVDAQGDKFYAKVVQVYPPKATGESAAVPDENQASSSSAPSPPHGTADDDTILIHKIGGDLKIPAKEALVRDDPLKYSYKVQILEEQHEKSHEKGKAAAKDKARWSGSLMDVQCSVMSRDRLAFSKSILRRFIRDCVDRDAAVASPWTVKPVIAKHYGVDSVMPEETRKGVEDIKRGEIDKRKKIWEDKEGPPTKKQKKMTAAQEERVKALAAAAEKREREAREKAERQQKAKEEAERLAAEKKKKKPVRYPTEDLDVRLSDKEKKAGLKVKKPTPSKSGLPFGDNQCTFEAFLMSWNFLVIYGQPLHLSTFTMDEFEHALRHSLIDPPCALLGEIHSTLIYNLRTVPFTRHSAVLSLLRLQDTLEENHRVLGVTVDELAGAMADVGNNWERVPLRHTEMRDGWEEALLGCLKDHATLDNFPRLREVLTRLLFAPEPPAEVSSSSSSSRVSSPDANNLYVLSSPSERYYALPPADRIDILTLMCNLAVSSKAIHSHMESCEEQLTALRKEKIEINRQKKQYTEEMNSLVGETEVKEEPGTNGNAADEDTTMHESSDLSDVPSEEGSETASTSSARQKRSARQKDLRQKAHTQAHAKQRELARAQAASAKQALAEHRRLDEEVNKLERRLEAIEREFRKLLGAVRVKPLGKDRFHNRIWWFDGMGSASLLGSGGVVQYGTGRIFIQGPSEMDLELMLKKEDDDYEARRLEEEGQEGMLAPSEWAQYAEPEELDEFLAWLNPKGVRELALRNSFTKWWSHVAPGMRKRISDLNISAKLPEARRSTRTKSSGHDVSREPYMMWTNRRAVNSV